MARAQEAFRVAERRASAVSLTPNSASLMVAKWAAWIVGGAPLDMGGEDSDLFDAVVLPGRTNNTWNNRLSLIRQVFAFGVTERKLESNPTDGYLHVRDTSQRQGLRRSAAPWRGRCHRPSSCTARNHMPPSCLTSLAVSCNTSPTQTVLHFARTLIASAARLRLGKNRSASPLPYSDADAMRASPRMP
jgi:hypothetical protein